MSQVIRLKENLNLSTFLKFLLQKVFEPGRLYKLSNVPGNDEIYIKYKKKKFT